jgi:hypothetical protein
MQILLTKDRRLYRRFRMKIPLIFCPMNTTLDHGHAAKSIDVSEHGVCFKTKYRAFVGAPVRVLLQPPASCRGKTATPVVFSGRISWVAAKRRNNQQLAAVGVEFYYSQEFYGVVGPLGF